MTWPGQVMVEGVFSHHAEVSAACLGFPERLAPRQPGGHVGVGGPGAKVSALDCYAGGQTGCATGQ